MTRVIVIAAMVLMMALPAMAADKPDPALVEWQQKVDKVNLERENAALKMQIYQTNYQQQMAIFQQKEVELKALQDAKPGAKKEKKAKD